MQHDASSDSLIPVMAAVASAFFMGTIGVFSKSTGLPAETITFFRLALGALFMLVYLRAISKQGLLLRWPTWPVLINGGMLAGFIIFYVQAMNLTTMANAIMMVYLAPLAASIVAHFIFHERLSFMSALLIGLALFGFAMMMEFRLDFSQGNNHALGLGFALLSMACYASFILINRRIRPDLPSQTRTFYQLLTGAAIMLPFTLAHMPVLTPCHGLWLIGVGLFPGFVAIHCAVVALEKLPAATFGTLAYLEPITVVTIGWTIFGETLSPLQMVGCALILGSGIVRAVLSSRG